MTQANSVVRDLRVKGDVLVDAPGVTLRRLDVVGGVIDNFAGRTCQSGLKVIRTTIRPGKTTTSGDYPSLGVGGYTARRVEIRGMPEGFRAGGAYDGCGEVKLVRSYARVVSPDICDDWHGDALQGYDGDRLTIRNSVLIMAMTRDCGGTAPFFYPSGQGNKSVDIRGLLVQGGGYPFRLGESGTVRELKVVADSWVYGPYDVKCSALADWEASVVTLDKRRQPRDVRALGCNTDSGS